MPARLAPPPPPAESPDQPLYRQLYLRLRESILAGSLKPGQRLPSSRALASQNGLARNTVLHAFQQLEVEGYIQAVRGSGHFVSPLLPRPQRIDGARAKGVPSAPAAPTASLRNGFDFVPESLRRRIPAVPFRVNLPELEHFPIAAWSRLQAAVLREARRDGTLGELLGEADAQGDPSLRHAIAEHVSIARAVRCTADTVIVTAGAQHAIDLLLRVLTQPGDAVLLEDPCFPGALSAARAAGCSVIPAPVDAQGADLNAGMQAAPPGIEPRVLLVCPSKQFPLGTTMSLPRRLALIEWARQAAAWIIEDDYDSEFRYAGRPVVSLQHLDRHSRVIYIGTFAKTMFPSLRTGFLVVPEEIAKDLAIMVHLGGQEPAVHLQAALADFIAKGHYAVHIQKTRSIYRRRQDLLVGTLNKHLDGIVSLSPPPGGVSLVLTLPPDIRALAVQALAAEEGLHARAVSYYALKAEPPNALHLGFAAVPNRQIEPAAARLADIIGSIRTGPMKLF